MRSNCFKKFTTLSNFTFLSTKNYLKFFVKMKITDCKQIFYSSKNILKVK